MQEPPQKIDKYQILSVLGKGAMGVVYHAYDPVVKRDVAIKFLSSLGSEETELISRFEREARLAGGLRHPNIVTIYDLGHYEGRPYIVMEYIVGRDLQAVIKHKQNLTFEQRVEVILQVCKGLDAAHQKGIIHRDIKPANIRLQEDNTVKIMDFGIARMGSSQLTRSGYIIGTLQYMSPEQISGEQLDPRTDIFSAGVIAYELFTFSNPFNGEHTVDIMYRILNIRPQPIQDLPEEYGTELNQIIMRALEKNRDLRYPSAKEMGQELEEYLFYLKSLRFRQRTPRRPTTYMEGATQTLPSDQLPEPPQQDPEISPTVISPGTARAASVTKARSEVTKRPPRDPEIPPTVIAPSNPEPVATRQSRTAVNQEIPPNVAADSKRMPTFGHAPSEKIPRTGIGANYSETGQVLMKESSFWQDKKFMILGVFIALAFIGVVIGVGTIRSKSLPIDTIPTGAEVLLNGQKIGNAPVTLEEKQDGKLTFRLEGYKEAEVNLAKSDWPDHLNVPLQAATIPTPGPQVHVIHVQTTPDGATVKMDGEVIGKTPTKFSLPDEKTHAMLVELDGYKKLEQSVDNTTPENLSLALQAIAVPGIVRYAGQYPVSMSVDGSPVRGSSAELDPGTYTLSFNGKRNAFIHFKQTVEVKSGETVTIKGPPAGMGSLTVKANPSNCKIYIDGEFVDTVPILNLPVQAGRHMVQFSWEKLGKKKSEAVNVSRDQTETVMGVPD